MTKTTTHSIEYDFLLRFNGKTPFQMGASVPSGTTDDDGQTIEFPGTAAVASYQETHVTSTKLETWVYVKILGDE